MSALPNNIHQENKLNPIQQSAIEQPDDTILSDTEVYELKGGDSVFAIKALTGIVTAIAYIGAQRELSLLRNFRIKSGTFIWANVFAIAAMSGVQYYYLKSSGKYARYKAHQLALYHRLVLNAGFMNENKKKPKFH